MTYAQTSEKRIVFSESRLGVFERCPRYYYLHYVRRLEPDEIEPNTALLFGQAVHEGGAILHSGGSLEAALEAFNQVYAPYDGLDKSRSLHLGEDLLTYYAQTYVPNLIERIEITDVERTLSAHVDGVDFIGIVDAIGKERESGRLTIVDLKSKSISFISTAIAGLPLDSQFHLYGGLVQSGIEPFREVLCYPVYLGTRSYTRGKGQIAKYVHRPSIVLTPERISECLTESVQTAKLILLMEGLPLRTYAKKGKRTGACTAWNRVCQFEGVCRTPDSNPGAVERAISAGFREREDSHA